MFEEFRPASRTGAANVRWFDELVEQESTVDGGALGWFPAGSGFPRRALVIPGQRRPAAEY
ncbi:MAG TPA: hypothetical protein VGM75_32685 [Pseudonocardiaceae bacterium]|jgi:hypothetical protein